MPDMRSHAIKPITLINNTDDNPYWDNSIDKYFARPLDPIFDQITYPNYFKFYKISTKTTNHTTVYRDQSNNIIVKRKSPIIPRFRYLKVQDGEMFFYQQLLCIVPCRSENELRGNFESYRDYYLHLNPHLTQHLHLINVQHTINYSRPNSVLSLQI